MEREQNYKSLIHSLRAFFLECPFLKEGVFNVDYLGAAPGEYCITTTDRNDVIKEYVDGSGVRTFFFNFESLENYGADIDENEKNREFYDELKKWIVKKSRDGELPDMGEDRIALRIASEGEVFVFDMREDMARYRLPCILTYYERG